MKRLKLFVAVLSVILSVSMMTACGGGSSSGSSSGSGGASEEAKSPTPCYVVTSMKIGKTELLTKDNLKDMGVDKVEDYLSMYLGPNGKAAIILGGDHGMGSWQEKKGKVIVDIPATANNEAETITLTKKDDKLVWTVKEDGGSMKTTFKRTDQIPAGLIQEPAQFFDVKYKQAETSQMNNAILNGKYYFDGDTVYGHFFTKGSACLGKGKIVKGELKEMEVLDKACIPTSIVTDGDYVYYVRMSTKDDSRSLVRIKKSGGKPETLYKGDADCIGFKDGKMYFTNSEHKYVKAELDGSKQKVLLDKEVYYAYWLNNDWLLYQDDADNETIHLYNESMNADQRITSLRSLSPVLKGTDLWYVQDDGSTYKLAKIDMNTLSEEVSGNEIGSPNIVLKKDVIELSEYVSNLEGELTSTAYDSWKDLVSAQYDPEGEYNATLAVNDTNMVQWEHKSDGVAIYWWAGVMGMPVASIK